MANRWWLAAGAVLFAGAAAQAQTPSTPAPQPLGYDEALQCSAVYAFLSGATQESDPDNSRILEDEATRWLVLAIMRDPDGGSDARAELEAATEVFGERVLGLEDDEEAIGQLIDAESGRCLDLRDANAEEFDAVDLSE